MTTGSSKGRVTTAIAQDRLIEAIAAVESGTAGGIAGMTLALPTAVELARAQNMPLLAEMWERFIELAQAVDRDLRSQSTR
jgi:hypothetical protein